MIWLSSWKWNFKKSNFDPCENVKNACGVVGKEEVSQEPWRVQTPNFAHWFRYIKTWILQNMSFVAHHSAEKLIF